ncbi:porin [Necropsobacter rosorum]|uniref:porin n=1 Tax=Necropsobacter rosorum TaxID=908285 RepID=UPI000509E88F
MKKTLVALAVAAAAVSASATTVYSNEGTTFDIGGRVDVALGKFGDNQRGDLRNNESRIDFHAEHQITDGVKALAHLRIRFNDKDGDTVDRWDSNNSFNNPTTNKLWAGLQADNIGRLTFGRQNTSGDDVQLNDPTYLFGGNNNLTDGGKKVVTFRSADFELAQGQTLTFGLDYLFGQSDKNNLAKSKLKYGYGSALFYNGQYTDDLSLELNAGATFDKFDNGVDTSGAREKKSWRVASLLHYGPAALGAEYGQSTYKNLNDVDTDSTDGKARFLEVGAQYQVLPESKVYLQWQRNEFKGKTTTHFEVDDYSLSDAALGAVLKQHPLQSGDKALQNVYLVGADYAFTKNVVSYVEYAHSRVKVTKASTSEPVKDNENFYGVGLRVYF